MGHTPAVNVNDPYVQNGYIRYWIGGNNYMTATNPVTTTWYREVRPESQHSARNPVSGWRQPTPWDHRSWSVRAAQMSLDLLISKEWDQWIKWDEIVSWSVPPISVVPPVHEYLTDVAQMSAYEALKNQRINLGVMFAERLDTAKLLESTCEKIARGIMEYKDRRPKDWRRVKRKQATFDPRRARKAIPRSWLELQYGWAPLLNDINGVCQALAEAEVSGQPYYASVFGKAMRREQSEMPRYVSSTDGNLGYDVTRTEEHLVFTRLDWSLSFIGLQQFSQLGVTNPLEVLWERVPYSFVLDWLIPVGRWISCLDASLGWTFVSGTNSKKLTVTWEGSRPKWYGSAPNPFIFGPVLRTYHGKYDGMTREVMFYPPHPNPPPPRNPFTPKRTANALALLATALERTIK